MKLVEIPLEQLHGAPWNANHMDDGMMDHLRESVRRYGLVENLVVRPLGPGSYEVLSGNQRLRLLRELGISTVPCFAVAVDDANARLLAQALNRVRGQDDLGLKAELVREVLKSIPETEVMALLPESAGGLRSLASLGQETMAAGLQSWQRAREARLRNLLFKLTPAQLETVEKALSRMLSAARQDPRRSPNARGTALYLVCESFLKRDTEL